MRTILGKLNDQLLANLAFEACAFCTHVEAAVAYAGSPDHQLLKTCKEKGLRITFYGLLDDSGAVGVRFLKELLSWGPSRAEVRLVNGNFHAKVIWWRGFGAYVGSANLTDKAWFHNIEAGLFLEEEELVLWGVGAQLDDLFDHVAKASVPVTSEMIVKLESIDQARRPIDEQEGKLRTKFNELFQSIPPNPGLIVKPAKGARENKALKRFTAEWMQTLQLMRGLTKEFLDLKLHPRWVSPDAHPTIHFDQFLHAYYYDYVRGGVAQDDDDELSGFEKVESSFTRNRTNPAGALKEAAHWWAALPSDPHGEEPFIRETAPGMQQQFSKSAIQQMTQQSFTEAFGNVNAFRMHARQIKNTDFGLPPTHHESIEDRVRRLCGWLWEQRSPTGRTVRDVLEFVLWGTDPFDMEQRLWLGVWDDGYRIGHFGQSTLGEAVGWARPDDFPPRNNRTNKALRALGHDVKLFSKS